MCEKLLSSGLHETRTIAFEWALNCRKDFSKEDLPIFQNWIEKSVKDWSGCDDICSGPLGFFILDFPELLPQVFGWTKNKNMWLRRASAVCLIPSLRRGKYLENVFRTADTLMTDKEDLVQKGYGWALKEASKLYPKEVFGFVMKNKKRMSRTALRYAIEKLPERMKKEAMN